MRGACSSFIRDAMKYSDLVHALNKDPISNLRDQNRFWDFMSLTPESIQAVLMLFSERGVPASYRQMNGYGMHTFRWVNANNESFWVKYHFISEQGVASLTGNQKQSIDSNSYGQVSSYGALGMSSPPHTHT